MTVSAILTYTKHRTLCLSMLIAAFLLPRSLMAQSGWSQSTVCPGWNNPSNFVTGDANNYYSGQTGQKANEIPNVLTGQTGINWTTSVYTAGQLGTVTHSSASHCGNDLPFNNNMFAIMSDTMQVAGSPVNRDPNTGDTLPFVPTQFNRYDSLNPIFTTNLTRSIRIGDNCGSFPSAAKLTYNMFVTVQNAMMYLYYACVFESPNHDRAQNPLFYIRVMKQNAAGVWTQVNDTLAYAVESTPVTNGGSVVPGQNGWHAYGPVYYKEWNKVAINLTNYLYNDIRVEVMVSDCRASFHYGYAYVAGECGPATISASGCPGEQDTTVTTLMAPRSMVNYEWYASETGLLAPGAQTNPANSWRLLASGDSLENYAANVGDFRVTRRADGSACDSMSSQQTFRCRVTSALDPTKPFQTNFYINVQNTKPVMVVDTVVIGNNTVRFWNHSHVPGDATLVMADSTRWSFYSNADGSGTPDLVVYGDSVDYPVPATPHSVRVRTVTTGDNCNSEALYIIRPRPSSVTASCPACPEVRIAEKYDHTPLPRHALQGWDTVVDCNNRMLTLSSTTCVPVQYFNGHYTVEEIAYNPPDTTFYLGGQGVQIPITSDDRFAPTAVTLGFPFYFFGIKKEQFRVGDNGVVSFVSDDGYAQDGGSDYCPYTYTAPLPWAPGTAGAPSHFNRMHDAIYGIYEDTYTGAGGSYLSGNQGIYYGVVGEYPCRKIIASWNEIPIYTNASKRESYQMVCYEGSNIIEVHVKKRVCCSSTNGGRGTIGIQNATGLPQVSGAPGTTTSLVEGGAPAAFWPSGMNPVTVSLDSVAYRFSPVGYANYRETWHRLFDDGRDPVALTTNPNDTNGHFIPRGQEASADPNLSRAIVSPTVTTHYVYTLSFQNANNDWYNLYDTITVGVDTHDALSLHASGDAAAEELTLCQGDTASLWLDMDALQDTTQVSWELWRMAGGMQTALPASLLNRGTFAESGGQRRMPVSLSTTGLPGTTTGGVDSVLLRCHVAFANGCHASDSLLLRIVPAATSDTSAEACDHFVWHDSDHSASGDYVFHFPNADGCDSLVTLHLTLRHSTDTTVTHHMVENSLPYIWNGTSFETDTTGFKFHTTNREGCDSTVNFNLVVYHNRDTVLYRTVCEGELPMQWNGVGFLLDEANAASVITHQVLLTTTHGADSLVTMHLTVRYNSDTTFGDTIVQNALASFVLPLGLTATYTQDENDPPLVTLVDTTVVAVNAAGCDSTVHYTLSIYRNRNTYDTARCCDNQLPYTYRDSTFSPDGDSATYHFMYSTTYGTDSAVVFTLIVSPTYEVSDTHVICPHQPFVYEGTDYGGPAAFDTVLLTVYGCDSLVHVSLLSRDTLFHLAPMMSLDSRRWYPHDTTLLGCAPQPFWLEDTSRYVSRKWTFWATATPDSAVTNTLSRFDSILPVGVYSFRLVAVGDEGCADTIVRDSAVYVFPRPEASFRWEPDFVPNHDPQITLVPTATPSDSLTYCWLVSTTAGGNQFDTLQNERQRDGVFTFTWEQNIEAGQYEIVLIAYWLHSVDDSLEVACTDTARQPVTIVNTFLQFPNLVTPNGDGQNDTWVVVNLLETGQYSFNELWIYDRSGSLVYHVRNIYSESQFWDPNATNSPDGTYYFRFSGRSLFGVVKRNGLIEVLR